MPVARVEAGVRRPLPAQAYVYVIGPEVGPQKIGVASRPKERLADLQCCSPQLLRIKFKIRLDRKTAFLVEKEAHRSLFCYRSHGEWFKITAEQARQMVLRKVGLWYPHLVPPPPPVPTTWGGRLKHLGFSPRSFGNVFGFGVADVAKQLGSPHPARTPHYSKALVAALEMLSDVQRDKVFEGIGSEFRLEHKRI